MVIKDVRNPLNTDIEHTWIHKKTAKELREAQLGDKILATVIQWKEKYTEKSNWETISYQNIDTNMLLGSVECLIVSQ